MCYSSREIRKTHTKVILSNELNFKLSRLINIVEIGDEFGFDLSREFQIYDRIYQAGPTCIVLYVPSWWFPRARSCCATWRGSAEWRGRQSARCVTRCSSLRWWNPCSWSRSFQSPCLRLIPPVAPVRHQSMAEINSTSPASSPSVNGWD